MTTRRALWAIIGGSALLRLVWAASVGGYTNEAYYYMYAKHLDWGYFDHPPMVGFIAAVGLRLVGWLSPVLGLRIGFVALFAGSSWLLARLTARSFGPRETFLAVVAMNSTVFYGMMIGTFAEPDGPLLFFWLLTLDRLAIALDAPERTSAWVLMGLAWGAALLSKYHAVLLPAGAGLYLLLRPSARRCLWMPGPYLAVVAGLVVFSPVIVWNATHDWASFFYQGTRAKVFHGFQPDMLLEALLGQIFYLTPWIWFWLVTALVGLVRRGFRTWSDTEAFLVSQAVPALALFLGVATFQRIMPHWPLIGFVALFPIVGKIMSERLAANPVGIGRRLVALAVAPAVVGSLFVVHAHTGLFQDGRGRLLGLFSPTTDPTVDTFRWDQIARELKRRGLLDEPDSFLFTDSWRFSAELALATKGQADVACFHRDARSFTFWSRYEDWVGRDGIFVRVEDGLVDAQAYTPWFTRVEPIAEFPIVRAGLPIQRVVVSRCVRQVGPFQFGYRGDGGVPTPAGSVQAEPPVLGQGPAARELR